MKAPALSETQLKLPVGLGIPVGSYLSSDGETGQNDTQQLWCNGGGGKNTQGQCQSGGTILKKKRKKKIFRTKPYKVTLCQTTILLTDYCHGNRN